MQDILLDYRKQDSNILEISERNLKKLGYEQLKTGESQKGDLLCLVNKDRDLWAELDGHKSPAVTSFIVFSNRK